MKILVVANYNSGGFSPFVIEQMAALRNAGATIEAYGIVGKGFFGYLRNIIGIKRKIHEYHPDLIHAHYGLSGLCANLQRQIPVITTYHGSDIHRGGWVHVLSGITMKLSAYNIFVSRKLKNLAGYKRANASIVPCGVSIDDMPMLDKYVVKCQIGRHRPFVIFAGAYDNGVKNAKLAKEAMLQTTGVDLVELSGYSRHDVNLLMNAADCLLMTSHREGSPQVIKEAMACGTPIVSVDVGDVRDVIGDTEGCYIAERTPEDIAAKIKAALAFKGKTNGRQRIIDFGLSNDDIAMRLVRIYEEVMQK